MFFSVFGQFVLGLYFVSFVCVLLVAVYLIVSTSAICCLDKLLSEMTYYMVSE